MPIPNANRAIVPPEKIRDYLLNFDHPEGRSKAAWFHSLGYTLDRHELLSADLLAIAHDCEDFDTETTKFGVKYKALGELARPNRRPGKVMTVWIVENESPPRFLTAFPERAQ